MTSCIIYIAYYAYHNCTFYAFEQIWGTVYSQPWRQISVSLMIQTGTTNPANMSDWTIVDPMLVHRLRRWLNNKPTMGE